MSVTMLMLGVFAVSANASQSYELCNTLMMASFNYAAPDGDADETSAPTWIEVELASAGSLGVEVLYKVDKLEDVDYLKVTCSGNVALNAADWTSLKNMSKLKGLDLRQASFDAIPANEFNGRSSLNLVYLPEGMNTIGNYAFQKTKITTIDIPASVTSIGQYAFYQLSTLSEVNFTESSTLKTIGACAFYQCTALKKFLMPNTVTSLGTSAFYGCTNLSNLSLSSSLTSIPDYCFQNTSKLKNVAFPENLTSIGDASFANSGLENVILPIKLTQLNSTNGSDYGSFGNCKSLKYVELPSSVSNYYYSFRNCTALETVVCPSCTPPATNSLFYSVTLANVTLKVPSFSVVDYKLDTYWLKFGTIETMDSDPTYWRISSKLTLTNNRRPTLAPDVVLLSGDNCCMIVGGDAPFEVNKFDFNFRPSKPDYCRLVNRSPMTALGKVRVSYYVNANTWYFFTPITDVNLSDVTHGGNASYVFRYYDSENRASKGTTNNASWKNVTSSVLRAGQGYIFHCNKAGWLNLHPSDENKARAFISTDVTTELTAYPSENTANANWNYVGNPYPCYYDAYYMDFTAPFTVWDSGSSTYKAYSIVDDNYVFRPMEAFFVQKPTEISSILFKEEGREIESTVNRVATTRNDLTSGVSRRLYDILLTDGVYTDETRAIVNEAASLDYELARDAAKFMSQDEKVPQIYSIDEAGNLLAFNERPLDNGKVRLGFYAGEAGAYTLKGSPSCSENVKVYDAVTGITASLGKDGYHFTVEAGGTYNDRFTLMLSGNDITSIESTASAETQVTVVAGGIEVRPASASEISVYDAAGHQVAYAKAVSGRTFISLSSGLYLVKISGKTYKCVVL